ncbi:MAG TPA: glycosyltransferase family 4 protein [Candidatus Absconditabacterales bacterium]|nr:glycosyltransferase family 4 protein [Candidatus Absconditabacterales bacterium]HNG96941.1 glycosyltransferase family 4 protein [Candidatus Absconditabacterales bacterium]
MKKGLKIAMVSEGRDPIYGGGQMHVKYLCEGLIKNYDCSVDLFVRKLKDGDGNVYIANESLLNGKRNIIRTGSVSLFFSIFYRILWLLQVTCVLYQKSKQEKYDLIHGHALLPGIPIKIISWLTGIPCVYTVHGTMLLDANRKGLFYYIEKILTCGIKYDLEISVSKKLFHYKPQTKNLHVVYNGVDLQKIHLLAPQKKYNKLTFLTVARMDRQKNHQIILEVLKHIRHKISSDNIQFVRVGDGIEMQSLKYKISQYKLDEYIEIKGKLNYHETLQEFQKSHIFVLPSLGEGQPLTILESFASGLPVIATDVGDNKEFIQDKKNGILIKVGNIESLQKAILYYASIPPEQLEKQSEYCIKYGEQYDWNRVVQKTFNHYKDILFPIL